MLDPAIRDVDHAVSAELEESELRRAEPAANGEARTQPKSRIAPGENLDIGQPVGARELVESPLGLRRDTRLAVARATRTRRPVRTRRELLDR
jgi:hypothetical protein